MYCTHCGAPNEEKDLNCVKCGQSLREGAPTAPPAPPATPAVPIPNYLVQAILCTIFCCLPAGIVGIVYAAQVNTKVALGDLAAAQALSRKAKTWCWVSFGVGLVA